MTVDKEKLRALAEAAQEIYLWPCEKIAGQLFTEPAAKLMAAATPTTVLALLGEIEHLGNGMAAIRVASSAGDDPVVAHITALRRDAERYRWLRARDVDTIHKGGVFAGMTPQNLVINEETLDEAIDEAMAQAVRS